MSKEEMMILIVDDMEINRSILASMVEGDYRIAEAETGDEAIEILNLHHREIALILLDALMPGSDGFEVLEEMNKKGWIKYIPVIMVSTDESSDFIERAFALGAVDYMPRLSATVVVKKRISNTIQYAIQQRLLLQKEQERSEQIRLKDQLTGAYTLEGFREKVTDMIKNNPEKEYILWYGDIKNFKFVNNKYSTSEGDTLLKYFFKRTLDEIPEDGIICRISADRMAGFYTFDTNIQNDNVQKLRNELKEYMKSKYPTIMMDIYYGAYILEKSDVELIDIDNMISKAQMAQQTIKEKPEGGCAFYNVNQYETKARILEICGHIDKAIANGEVSIWIQPQIDYSTKKLVGGEALCRWTHENLGPISPGEFIPVLEEANLITKLDKFVWEEACKLIKKWKDEGKSVPISVNVSRVDIFEIDVAKYLKKLVEQYDISPDMLRIEITENIYMEKAEHMMNVVKQLQQYGFTVEMDDFGSGFSSLNILRNVPLDVLKLDLGFLRDEQDETPSIKSGNIISAIVRMAYGMDMPIIAEGVETAQQADFLCGLGCNLMQGYLFSKPLQISEFEKLTDTMDLGSLPNALNGQNMNPVQELYDSGSMSSYIFNHCVGAAALVEYSGEKLEFIIQNEEFTKLLGIGHKEFEKTQMNILESMHSKDRKLVQDTIEEAIRYGYASCELLSPYTKKWLSYDFRHVSDGINSALISCMVKDATNEYNLRHEVGAVAPVKTDEEINQSKKVEDNPSQEDLQDIKGIKISTFNTVMFYITSAAFVLLILTNIGVRLQLLENDTSIRQLTLLQCGIIIVMLCLFLMSRIVNINLVADAIKAHIDALENDRFLPNIGAYEFRKMACIYNHMTETNAANKEILQYASEHDNLTGVLNRRAYDALTRLYRLERKKMGLLITDADKFKNINDTYGHDVGDKILKKIAYMLQTSFRSNDKIIRFGGDEFVVILGDMIKENSYIVDRKISEINEVLLNPDDGLPPISISAGVAFSECGFTDELFKEADTKLYEAKNKKGNFKDV